MARKNQSLTLSRLLKKGPFPELASDRDHDNALAEMQLEILRVQQGVWHQKKRVVIVFEGFDASGKGGAIRRLVKNLDPRGYQVHSVGEPTHLELSQHYLTRFWINLPRPGCISIFDRSWYGRVLVERVENLIPKERWKAAYDEINAFEAMLVNDDIHLIKIFLAIDKKEQLRRFELRLQDPYKQWKLNKADVEARSQWNEYVSAVDEVFQKTSTPQAPWHLVAANDKPFARMNVLLTVADELKSFRKWMESKAQSRRLRSLKSALRELGLKDGI